MRFSHLINDFITSEKSGGLLLIGATLLSLVLANTDWLPGYTEFWHQHLDLSFAGLNLDLTLEAWINDGAMTIFFVLVGLEMEREIYAGELSKPRQALLPVGAAIGGMLVPAAVHYLFNRGTPTEEGYGIPMATDIAFALGILSLLGNRIPYSLKVFLTALAIIDDLGAILVIAFFYSNHLSLGYLGGALGLFGVLLLLNRMRLRVLWVYLLLGVGMWYCMLHSGVHATLAGVLFAFALPFSGPDESNLSYRAQHTLHKPVGFFILPLFALANTAIFLGNDWLTGLTGANSLGIIAGLVIGKPVGILGICWLLLKFAGVTLPEGLSLRLLAGAALLGGIGFTMSIFISGLAFSDSALVQSSKIAVLIASVVAALLGLGYLSVTVPKKNI